MKLPISIRRAICWLVGHQMRTMYPTAAWSAKRCNRCLLVDDTPDAREQALLDAVSCASMQDFCAAGQGRATAEQVARVRRAEQRVAAVRTA